MICPAYAGMILTIEEKKQLEKHLSRVCGDDPYQPAPCWELGLFVPRMRG